MNSKSFSMSLPYLVMLEKGCDSNVISVVTTVTASPNGDRNIEVLLH